MTDRERLNHLAEVQSAHGFEPDADEDHVDVACRNARYVDKIKKKDEDMGAERNLEADISEFKRLMADDEVWSIVTDDMPVLSSEEALAERAIICAPENRT